MGMRINETDLLPTEQVVITKFANLWVKPSQEGLSKFAFNKYLGDNEAIGGSAFLTNYRIMFKSHGFNRLVGMHSLFLPNLVRIRKGIFGIAVESRAQAFHFVMWFNKAFVDAANARKAALGPNQVAQLRKLIAAHPDRIGALKKQQSLEAVNKVLSGALAANEALASLAGGDKSTFAELVELLSS